MSESALYDLVVIGGGINGAGIARDAAGRGLSVLLCEKDDLAEGTSSRSGKLIHGGLRYLEYYEFRLVREALIEREVLLGLAPHIIWPLRFVLPHSPEQRPAWLIRLGLLLYDHLGGRKRLSGTRAVDLLHDPVGYPLLDDFRRGFEYSDCWVDDARLVVLNALDAAERGATILTRTRCLGARREGGVWRVELRDGAGGETRVVQTRVLVNAAGPWVEQVIAGIDGAESSRRVRLVKGSHIVIRKFWEGPQAYLLQNSDGRVIFVNPYLRDLALIGTTDVPYEGLPEAVQADEAEIDYLLSVLRRYFRNAPGPRDVIERFSGVRPLYDDAAENPSAVTRDYVLELQPNAPTESQAPLLSIFGGKITTYRKLAEQALDSLRPFLPRLGPAWSGDAPLPGGDIPDGDFEAYRLTLARRWHWMPAALVAHYARLYGTRAEALVGGAQQMSDLGRHAGGLFYEAELDYLVRAEWARHPADILQRRTKHGLMLSTAEQARLTDWMTLQRQQAS